MTDRKTESDKVHHPVLVAMIAELPNVGSVWPMDERVRWLQALESVLHMVYGTVDRLEIGIALTPVKIEGSQAIDAGKLASSAEPTDEAMGRDAVAASGSSEVAAETTEAPAKPGMGSERSSSAETQIREAAESHGIDGDVAVAIVRAESVGPKKNVGGAPSKSGRPAGIPSNLAMAIGALKELGGRASAADIRDWARKKHWPKMPDHWTAVLYEFVNVGHIERAGMDFKLPDAKPRQEVVKHAPKPPPAFPTLPAPKPAAPPRGFTFKHGDKSVMLQTAQQLTLATRLLQAKGQHIGEAFLAEKVLGSNTERHRDTIKAQATGLNGALFEVGLKVTYYPGHGLIMKDVE